LEEEDTDPLIGTALQRAKRLVKEGVSRTSVAAKVAQICERESGRMSSSDLTGTCLEKEYKFWILTVVSVKNYSVWYILLCIKRVYCTYA
jgi:hypothetical protein